MKKKYGFLSFLLIIIMQSCQLMPPKEGISLGEAFEDYFYIGTALNMGHISGEDVKGVDLIKKNFNSIVAENCMKSGEILTNEKTYDFSDADKFIQFGEENQMDIIGHTLIWHSQLPNWFCVDENGENISPDELRKRMYNHINMVMTRYKGKVRGWDVVNEAIEDDGSYRNSKFYQILGEEFILYAFEVASQIDPEAELYYNDYSMAIPAKREGVVRLIKKLKERGIRIDGIGMQTHVGLDYPSLDEFEKSILAYSNEGVKVMITEMDISALPSPFAHTGAELTNTAEYQEKMNPYVDGLPEDISQAWRKRVVDFFNLFLKHSNVIDRVTLWGVTDGDSWKNDFPIPGRTDYTLLFDRDYQPKPVVDALINNAIKFNTKN